MARIPSLIPDSIETDIYSQGKIIAGIDEVGRGCWAGPLLVSACVLPAIKTDRDSSVASEVSPIAKLVEVGVADSKKLSPARRQKIYQDLVEFKETEGFEFLESWQSAALISDIGLAAAIKTALFDLETQLSALVSSQRAGLKVFLDGGLFFSKDTNIETETVTRGDQSRLSIAAASIWAKQRRDSYMYELAKTHSQYGFETHVGYGTARHREALEKYGVCAEHRLSFAPVAKYSQV